MSERAQDTAARLFEFDGYNTEPCVVGVAPNTYAAIRQRLSETLVQSLARGMQEYHAEGEPVDPRETLQSAQQDAADAWSRQAQYTRELSSGQWQARRLGSVLRGIARSAQDLVTCSDVFNIVGPDAAKACEVMGLEADRVRDIVERRKKMSARAHLDEFCHDLMEVFGPLGTEGLQTRDITRLVATRMGYGLLFDVVQEQLYAAEGQSPEAVRTSIADTVTGYLQQLGARGGEAEDVLNAILTTLAFPEVSDHTAEVAAA